MYRGAYPIPSMRNYSEVCCRNNYSEPFAVEVGLHLGSDVSPLLFGITVNSLTENIRRALADSRMICGAVRKGERRAGGRTGAMERSLEEKNEVSRAKT